MQALIAALSLGFLSSMHCVGMCGPIALALPLDRRNKVSEVGGILVYNAGRVMSYALLGGFLGLAGMGLLLAGYQQGLSVGMGVLLLAGLLYLRFRSRLPQFQTGWTKALKSAFGNWFGRKDPAALWMIGLLNGLLPCGMVYIALAGATVSGTFQEGALFMAAFGLGTLPSMLSVSLFSGISVQTRKWLNKISPSITLAVAVLLILRGLSLGIPYVSPKKPDLNAIEAASCHTTPVGVACPVPQKTPQP